MYSRILAVLVPCFLLPFLAQAQDSNQQEKAQEQNIRIAGKIVDYDSGKPVDFAAIQVLAINEEENPAKPIGTVTDENGVFDFAFVFKAPYKLVITHITYQRKEIVRESPVFDRITIKMLPNTLEGEAIYVTSQIYPEEELSNKVTVDKISAIDVEQVTSFSAFDMVANLREVDVATQSMNLKSISTRGFNSSANPRFLQLTDGADNVSPGLGFPVGDLLGPNALDIESMELIVGPSSAMYGSSAMSGVLNTQSLSPFRKQGIAFSIKTGMHHLDAGGSTAWGVTGDNLTNFDARIAKVFAGKLGVKVTGSYTSGLDWRANNYDNIGHGRQRFERDESVGYNGVNIYGDENYVYLPVGSNFEDPRNDEYAPVTRTGYREKDLVDYDIATIKGTVGLEYRFTDNASISFDSKYGKTNTLYTSDSRIRLQDFELLQHAVKVNIGGFYAHAYTTSQKSGNSFNVNVLANELMQAAKTDDNWYRDFLITYQRGNPLYGIPANSINDARKFADWGITYLTTESALPRFEPGSEELALARSNSIKNVGFNSGSGIRDNSELYHVQSGYKTVVNDIDIHAGGSFRFLDLDSDGSIFPDTTDNNISNYNYGAFLSLGKENIKEGINVNFSIGIEKNEQFEPIFNQQLGASYQLSETQFLRASISTGARYPTVREQFVNSNLGDARLLGGNSIIHQNYELNTNSFYQIEVDRFNQNVNELLVPSSNNASPYNRPQAELESLYLLEQGIVGNNDIQQIRTEKLRAFELGYRNLITDNIYLDLSYFISFYTDFIGVKRIIKPRTSPTTDLYTAAGQVNNSLESDVFYVQSNSDDLLISHGMSWDLNYSSGEFVTSINGTITGLVQESDDPIIPGFNTPPLKINFEWGNREIVENVGFKFAFKYRTAFDWQSTFLDGRIESYGHFDAQFNAKIPAISSTLKAGVSNMGILSYYDVYGGPAIGSILFATLTFNR